MGRRRESTAPVGPDRGSVLPRGSRDPSSAAAGLTEARRRDRFAGLLTVILLAAAALRFVGLRWGLPSHTHYFSYHPDEIFLLLPSVSSFAHGDWNPHFFNYGTLYIYLVGLPATWFGLAPAQFPQGLAPLYLLGRAITAVLGLGSVALLYVALKRESRGLALVSAALLALLPLHVIESHYATVDVPATFFLVLAFLFTLRGAGAQHAPLLRALPAGLAVGLAAATKYNAGLFLLPVLAAPYLRRAGTGSPSPATGISRPCLSPPSEESPLRERKTPRRRGQARPRGSGGNSSVVQGEPVPARPFRLWFVGVILGALVGFFIGCPYVSSPEFAKDFLFELNHARVGGTYAFVDTGSGWGYHLWHGLPVALGFPLLLALIPGLLAAIRLPSRAVRLSLLWCVLYFAMIGFSKERFIRYLVPMAPFLAVIAAQGLLWLWRAPKTHLVRAAAAAVGLAVIVLTGLYTIGQLSPLTGDDPRDRAWGRLGPMLVGLNPGNLRAGVVQPPWYFSPPLSPYNAGPLSRPAFVAWDRKLDDRIVVTGWDATLLQAVHPAVFVLSDLESADLLRLKDKDATAFVAALHSAYKGRVRFAPDPAPFSWLAPGRGWAPPDWLYPSPVIDAYSNVLQPDANP